MDNGMIDKNIPRSEIEEKEQATIEQMQKESAEQGSKRTRRRNRRNFSPSKNEKDEKCCLSLFGCHHIITRNISSNHTKNQPEVIKRTSEKEIKRIFQEKKKNGL